MLNSVEHRSPFLGKNLINFSLNTNIGNLFNPFKSKYLIKKIFKKIIPKFILNNKKHGFAFPKDSILNQKKLINRMIDTNLLTNKNFFFYCYDQYLKKNKDYSIYLWNEIILNFSLQNLTKKN